MGRHVHRLTDVDEEARRAICAVCGPVTIYVSHANVRDGDGNVRRVRLTRRCANAFNAYRKNIYGGPWEWKKFRDKTLKGACERCGFVPEDRCQLDLDHVPDGTFLTLCANCHRLITVERRRKAE